MFLLKVCQQIDLTFRKNCPKIGNVRYFLITEKQFRDMKMIVGKESRQEKVKNINHLEEL